MLKRKLQGLIRYELHFVSSEFRCPQNYRFYEGDAKGNQWNLKINGNYSIHLPSIDECRRLCDPEKDCMAIEWSQSQHLCALIHIPKPDGPEYMDFKFCSKLGMQVAIYMSF